MPVTGKVTPVEPSNVPVKSLAPVKVIVAPVFSELAIATFNPLS